MSNGVIVTHHKGMMHAAKVLERLPDMTKVLIDGNKHPKWIEHDDPTWKITDTTDEAIEWIDSLNEDKS